MRRIFNGDIQNTTLIPDKEIYISRIIERFPTSSCTGVINFLKWLRFRPTLYVSESQVRLPPINKQIAPTAPLGYAYATADCMTLFQRHLITSN